MQPMVIGLVEQLLTAEVFCALRATAGFPPYSLEDAAFAIEKTLYTVEARAAEGTIGMARVVGDDRLAFFIKDVVVDPACRGMGVGRLLVKSVMSYIASRACDGAYVGLMSTPGTESFYEKFGFIARPAPGLGHGMVQFIHPSEWAQNVAVESVGIEKRKAGSL